RQVSIHGKKFPELKTGILIRTREYQPLDIRRRETTRSQRGHIHQGVSREVRCRPGAVNLPSKPFLYQQRQQPAVVEMRMSQKDSANAARFERECGLIRPAIRLTILYRSAINQVIAASVIHQRAGTSHAPESANKSNFHDALLSQRD